VNQLSAVNPELPDPATQAAMARVWAIYEAVYEEMQVELRERLANDPDFGPLVRDVPPDPDQEARSRALQAAAMQRGEWEPYWDNIRAQSAGYANAEISLAAWIRLVHMFRIDLVERIYAAHEGDRSDLHVVMKSLHRWLDDVIAVFAQTFVTTNEQVIARQQAAIRQISTPVLQLRVGLLILPIVGALDRERLEAMRVLLLQGIRDRRARVVVLDVTGVPEVDSVAANQLIAAVVSARMMGAEVIVSGLSAEIAQTLVTIGIDLSQVISAGDLQGGIEMAEGMLANGSPLG
jgi:rsbT co-antagonist protein RsbR